MQFCFFWDLYISWGWMNNIKCIRFEHLKGIGSKVSLWICVHCPVQFLQERGGECRNDFGINSILNEQKCTFTLSLRIGNVWLFMDAVEGFDTLRPAQFLVFCYCFTHTWRNFGTERMGLCVTTKFSYAQLSKWGHCSVLHVCYKILLSWRKCLA